MADIQETIDALQTYLTLGWHLLPIHGIRGGVCRCPRGPACASPGKHPLVADGLHAASNDAQVVIDWVAQEGDCNWAVSCQASGLVVLDIDPRNDGDLSYLTMEELLDGAVPLTVEAGTGGGVGDGPRRRAGSHLYFKVDEGSSFVGNLKGAGLPGIDIKHKGYVVIPPSVHASGHQYRWLPERAPWDLPVAPLSDALVGLLKKSHVGADSGTTFMADDEWTALQHAHISGTAYGKSALAREVHQVEASRPGERNDTLNRAAYNMAQLIAGRQISYIESVSELRNAALKVFTEADGVNEVDRILRPNGGALQAGAARPRTSPSDPTSDHLALFSHDVESVAAFRDQLNIQDWDELWSSPVDNEWLVDGIIKAGAGHSIYGDAGVGKSLLVRELAACLASGRSPLGLPAGPPIKVMYLDYENDPYRDVRTSLEDMGFGPHDLRNFLLLSFPDVAPFDTPRGKDHFSAAVELLKPDLVIIDTVSRVVAGKENENDTWLAFYTNVGKFLKSKQIAYVRIDHEGKSAGAGARGGSAKKGDVDLVWRLSATRSENQFTLTAEKHRMPLTQEVHHVTRSLEPLRHRILHHSVWPTILAEYALFEAAQTMVLDLQSRKASGRLPSARECWRELGDRCKAEGISRTLLEEALRSIAESKSEE